LKTFLLITDVPPSKYFSGGLLTEQIIRLFPSGSVACFLVMDANLPHKKPTVDLDVDAQCITKPTENAGKRNSRILRFLLSFVSETLHIHWHCRRLVKKGVNFGKKHRADAVWCILQGQTMITIGYEIAKSLNLPLFTQVWDHPSWWMMDRNVNIFHRLFYLKKYNKTIRASKHCGAASWNMAEEYHNIYGVPSFPIVASLDATMAHPPAERLSSDKTLTIGLTGQIYAKDAWNSLLASLDSVNWQISGRSVSIEVLGGSFTNNSSTERRIVYRGYVDQKRAISIMSQCDILYCPYPFDSSLAEVAKTSFPSKLTTYLAAGRPVLFHGPDYSSPASFLKANNTGLLCHSMSSDAILREINSLIEFPKYYEKECINSSQTFHRHLTMDVFEANVKKFLVW